MAGRCRVLASWTPCWTVAIRRVPVFGAGVAVRPQNEKNKFWFVVLTPLALYARPRLALLGAYLCACYMVALRFGLVRWHPLGSSCSRRWSTALGCCMVFVYAAVLAFRLLLVVVGYSCWLFVLLCGHLSTTWALVRLAQFSSCMRSCLLPGSSSWWFGSLWSAASFSVGIGNTAWALVSFALHARSRDGWRGTMKLGLNSVRCTTCSRDGWRGTMKLGLVSVHCASPLALAHWWIFFRWIFRRRFVVGADPSCSRMRNCLLAVPLSLICWSSFWLDEYGVCGG
jgi:hypothetical protein